MHIGIKLLSIVLSMFLAGCFTLPSPTSSHDVGTVTMNHEYKSEEVEPEADKTEESSEAPAEEPDPGAYTNGMSPSVVVLLGLGAATMMVATGASVMDDAPDHPEFTIITGGIGLLLWGAAGIVYLAE